MINIARGLQVVIMVPPQPVRRMPRVSTRNTGGRVGGRKGDEGPLHRHRRYRRENRRGKEAEAVSLQEQQQQPQRTEEQNTGDASALTTLCCRHWPAVIGPSQHGLCAVELDRDHSSSAALTRHHVFGAFREVCRRPQRWQVRARSTSMLPRADWPGVTLPCCIELAALGSSRECREE